MNTLSLCMIVKDEEPTLKRVLDAAKVFADEIIIVDTGSTDASADIALNAGAKVFSFDWIDDFSAARNYSVSLSKGNYVMWLDADDVILPEDAQRIALLKKDLSADMVVMPYKTPSLEFFRERIIRREYAKFVGRVHEAIEPRGKVIRWDIPVYHDKVKKSDKRRNLNIFESMIKSGATLSGRDVFYYGSELYYNGMFDKAIKAFEEFLIGQGNACDKGQASLFLSRALSEKSGKLAALSRGTEYCFSPDLFCETGEIRFASGDFRHAKNAYLCALIADENITFHDPRSSGYLPHIRLCACYWSLGDRQKAKFHNDKVLELFPSDKYALLNKRLFE